MSESEYIVHELNRKYGFSFIYATRLCEMYLSGEDIGYQSHRIDEILEKWEDLEWIVK